MEEEPVDKPAKKRQNTGEDANQTPQNKKVRLGFSGKKFRELLKTDQKSEALQDFLNSINEDSRQDSISSYLQHGGNCTEILQLLENDSSVPPVLIFEIINHILLQINAKFAKFQSAAYDCCRYLLNNYITLINRMLGLSSSMKERLVTLKLLTTIVTFSVVLAKDILLHVNFNPANLELLTKVSEKNEARGPFIHFIIAFLVDGHYPALSVLLEKKGLMTSIISGLQFDSAEVVALVLTVMKEQILQNASVSKTAKMKVFSTQVVKEIVNLYNWKGPAALPNPSKKNKTIITVDEIEKSQVNAAVHSFLIVLCTSHKFGVVFRDYNVGLNQRQNSLVYTVLEKLERPWEHSYAGELVVEICKACPDLTRVVWKNMKEFLEPRWTTKWLNTMKFAQKLLDQLQPECIEFCLNSLSVQQLSQVISSLISPVSILKTIISESFIDEKPAVKHQILLLLLKMLKSAQNYINRLKKSDHTALQTQLANHFTRNLPDIKFVLTNWDSVDEDSPVSDYLEAALDLLSEFRQLNPKILANFDLFFDIEDFLNKTETVIDDKAHLRKLQIKAVKLLLDLEPAYFRPKSNLFETILLFSFEFYYETKDDVTLSVLHKILQSTNIFDNFLPEIDIWIDAVLNLKKYDASVVKFLCDLIKKADVCNREGNCNFSILLSLLAEGFNHNEICKATKNYLNFVVFCLFHLQNQLTDFWVVVSQVQVLSNDLLQYIEKWKNSEICALNKCKGTVFEYFSKFCTNFLEDNEEIDFENLDLYPNFKLNLLQALIFYLTNLIKANSVKENHIRNCTKFIDFLISQQLLMNNNYLSAILGNNRILQNLTVFENDNFVAKFMIEIVQKLKGCPIEAYLVNFREKIVSNLMRIFKKPGKYTDSTISVTLLETFGLDYQQCRKVIEKFIDFEENKRFYRVACYCLQQMSILAQNRDFEPLSNDTIRNLGNFFKLLIDEQVSNLHNFSSGLLSYLQIFPHNIEGIEIELLDRLLTMPEFAKENISLCEFLLERRPEFMLSFRNNLDAICAKKGFLLPLLHVVIEQNDDILEEIYAKFENQIAKALQKPHKAGQHFQKHYESVSVLIEKFLKPDKFAQQIQKFESTELFHVYFLKIIFSKIENKDKKLGNMIMTFVHLLMNLIKQKGGSESIDNFDKICEIFADFLKDVEKDKFENLAVSSNETFKMFCKLCLKYGIAGDVTLTEILAELVGFMNEEDAKLILEMLFSHSQFLDAILGDFRKTEIFNLWRVLCVKWPQFMDKNHVPVLLSAYKASRSSADKIILDLMKMYEANKQTKFHDFKPFLWGRAAASHYSVRSDLQKSLWRQPKMGDILDNLHFPTILATISQPNSPDSYDLDYFLPLFSHLLAPENPVQTYRFTRSGALALTLTGFRGDKSQKCASFYVLSRFYFHLEARQSGKDTLLWMRFIEAICKATAVLDDFGVNNFVGIFLARMALILTQPTDVMYVPLTQYLSAKDSLDFNTIPELYTFLHSPHVNSKEHRNFILEVLRDGLTTQKDLTTFLRSMGFKLISELCSSTVCDLSTKILILEIFKKCCLIPLGVKILCGRLSFLVQMFSFDYEPEVLVKLVEILLEIVKKDDDRHRNFVIYMTLLKFLDNDQCFHCLSENKGLEMYYHALGIIADRFPQFFTKENLENLLEKSNDKFCKYLKLYGCRFVRETDFCNNSSGKYLRLFFYNRFKCCY